MKKSFPPLVLLAATCAQAAPPAFEDRGSALPGRHSYIGGWEHFVGGGIAIFDCNGDMLPDIFAAGGEAAARLFINRSSIGGDLAFEAADGASMTGVTGAYPLDINGDSHPDLVVLRTGPDEILLGEGNCAFGVPEWAPEFGDHWSTAFSATWEPDADWPTLAFGHYVDRNDPDGPFQACDANHLYRFGANGYDRPHLLKPGYCALSVLFSDWRRRGRADLRISNDRHYYVRGGSEQMWIMPEPHPLTPADGWEAISIWGMGIASEDINGDTRPDVVLTSMGDQLMMMQDAGGRYKMAPYAIGTFAQRPYTGGDGRPSTGWHAEFADVDNDGRSDLFIAKGNVDQMPSNAMRDPNNLLMQGNDGTFWEAGAVAGIATMERARGAGLADFNLDGRLDIVVMNRRAPMELWQNVTEGGNWLSLSLRQAHANRDAIGAWIELNDGSGRLRVKERTVGGGHASGQLGPIHFGLGNRERAEMRVIWPDGTKSGWIRLTANARITLTRRQDGTVSVSER